MRIVLIKCRLLVRLATFVLLGASACDGRHAVVSGNLGWHVLDLGSWGHEHGDQAGSQASPVLLGDYKTDPDAELERPTRVALIDTREASLRLVDLGTRHSFRPRARGREALVLGTDGAIHVIDPDTGRRVDTIDVVGRWREPLDWQQPRPALPVVGDTAYATDPRRDRVHVVDLARGEVTSRLDLPHTPNEIVANAG